MVYGMNPVKVIDSIFSFIEVNAKFFKMVNIKGERNSDSGKLLKKKN